jgi:hypothetical protein
MFFRFLVQHFTAPFLIRRWMPMAQVGCSGVISFHDFDLSMRDASDGVTRGDQHRCETLLAQSCDGTSSSSNTRTMGIRGWDQDWHFNKKAGLSTAVSSSVGMTGHTGMDRD